MRGAATDLDGTLCEIARFQNSLRVNRADDNVDGVLFETLEFSKVRNRNQISIDIKRVESLALGPARDVAVKSFASFDQRRQDFQRPAFRRRFNLFDDRGQTLLFHGQITVGTKLRAGLREK